MFKETSKEKQNIGIRPYIDLTYIDNIHMYLYI